MRLPMKGSEVDLDQTRQMVDTFLAEGFNYFDTAHGYIQGKSETALRACLTSRYPRDQYILTNKLTGGFFKSEEEIRPLFAQQLAACGVDYFDFYLMHAQNANEFQKFKACRAYETAFALKAEGKVRHVGISFHDTADVLEQILTEYPQIEVVQIQFNYVDYDDPAVQSRKCYTRSAANTTSLCSSWNRSRAATWSTCRRTQWTCSTRSMAAAPPAMPSALPPVSRA